MEGARLALLVATHDYQDVSLRKLRAPARDAEEFARVLHDPQIGGFDVVTVINEPSYQVRRKVQGFLASAHRDDTLLLYFSCHGVKDDGGRLFLATIDTEIQLCDSTSVESNLVSDQVRRSRARRIVIVLDCCYSGAFGAGGQAKAGDHVGVEDHLELGRGRLWLTSSNAMEYSFEGNQLERGERSGLVERSIFTQAMVRGLETGDADRDGDGLVSIDELYDYVFDEVQRATPNQHPRKGGELEGRLYLARNPKPLRPVALPSDIQAALGSLSAGARLGIVTHELTRLLQGSDTRVALSAAAVLGRLSREDDSLSVRAAATAALEGWRAPAGDVALAWPTVERGNKLDEGDEARLESVTGEQAGREAISDAADQVRKDYARRDHTRREPEMADMESANPPLPPSFLDPDMEAKRQEFLRRALARLTNSGFELSPGGAPGYDFVTSHQNWGIDTFGNVQARVFFMFTTFSSLDAPSLQAFSEDCFRDIQQSDSTGRLRRRTLVCFAVALVPSVDPATGAAVRSKPATKHLNGFEIPILVDLGTGEIFHLEKTPIWGVQFYGGFRKLAGRILGPGRHHRG